MEKLSNILKSYNGQSKDSRMLEVEAKLKQVKIVYKSLKIQNTTLVLYVGNHLEATELKYKQNYLRKVLEKQNIQTIVVHTKD